MGMNRNLPLGPSLLPAAQQGISRRRQRVAQLRQQTATTTPAQGRNTKVDVRSVQVHGVAAAIDRRQLNDAVQSAVAEALQIGSANLSRSNALRPLRHDSGVHEVAAHIARAILRASAAAGRER